VPKTVRKQRDKRASEGSKPSSRELQEINQQLLLAGLRERDLAERASAIAADLRTLLEGEQFLKRTALLFADSRDYRAALQQVVRLAVPQFAASVAIDFLADAPGERIRFESGEATASVQTWELSVPIRIRGAVIGALTAAASHPVDATDEVFFEQLAERAGIAFDNGRLLEQTESAIRMRDELLAAISHDFGSPLAAVRFSAKAIELAVGLERLPQSVAQAAATIQLAEGEMAAMLSELVEMATVHSGKMTLQRDVHDLGALVEQVFHLFEGKASVRSLRLVREGESPTIYCDRRRVLRLLGNVVGNAIKFAPEGSAIRVQVETLAEEARVTVRDRGPGIPEDLRPRLFEPWSRGGEGAGSGLGLYIARGIARAHGGDLSARSCEPGDCSFRIVLPRSAGK
jgi:signal transduction histidine kinase